jgi:drug/metabolite transporter (DMT)-like permease
VSAIVYLITFGSLVGYSAFVYAMDKLPVAIVSVYPYVNAVVAVTLGWLFYREPFGWRETGAMVIIFGGVAVVKRYSQAPVARSAAAGRELGPEGAPSHAEQGDKHK